MAKGLQEILGGRQMTGVVKTVATGLPNYFPPEFMSTTKRVIGNKSTFMKVQGERAGAKTVQYGAPAQRVTKRPLAEAGVTLMHAFEEMSHDPIVLQNLMGVNGDNAAALAVEEVDRQTVEFKKRTENARNMSLASTLRYGQIYIGANGDLLLSSSGAAVTVDFSVPANNQNQLNSIISAGWDVAGTKILDQINALKKTAVQTTGRELEYAFYGANILNYLIANTQAGKLFTSNPVLLNKVYETGEIPDGFCGLKWRPAYRAFGLNTSGTVTDWWGGDTITFCPRPSSEWWQWQEGSYIVPRSIGNVYADAVAAARDVDLVYGTFAYGVVSHNPVTIMQYVGDTWMPVLASPSDLFIADVTP